MGRFRGLKYFVNVLKSFSANWTILTKNDQIVPLVNSFFDLPSLLLDAPGVDSLLVLRGTPPELIQLVSEELSPAFFSTEPPLAFGSMSGSSSSVELDVKA